MNDPFDEAIFAHLSWLARFDNALQGIDRDPFDAAQLRDDRVCTFGRWLHANPDAFADAASFESIRAQHKSFHECAADIAEQVSQLAPRAALAPPLAELMQRSQHLMAALRKAKAAAGPT